MKKACKYNLIKEYLISLIDDHAHTSSTSASDFLLPSENQLAQKFNVNRITSKHALNLLVEENIAYRIQGKGTFAYKTKAPEKTDYAARYKNTRINIIMPTNDSFFVRDILKGALIQLREMHIDAAVHFSLQDSDYEARLIQQVIRSYTSGLIINPAHFEHFNKEILSLYTNRIPTVFVDFKPHGLHASFVSSDHYHSAYQAADTLIKHGKKNIVYFLSGLVGLSSIQERINGINDALKHNNVPFMPYNFVRVPQAYDDLYRVMKNCILENNINGVIMPSGYWSNVLFDVLSDLNMTPFSDICVFCYDQEIPDYADIHKNKYVRIMQNPIAIGQEAANCLINLIERKSDTQTICIPFRFENTDAM